MGEVVAQADTIQQVSQQVMVDPAVVDRVVDKLMVVMVEIRELVLQVKVLMAQPVEQLGIRGVVVEPVVQHPKQEVKSATVVLVSKMIFWEQIITGQVAAQALDIVTMAAMVDSAVGAAERPPTELRWVAETLMVSIRVQTQQ